MKRVCLTVSFGLFLCFVMAQTITGVVKDAASKQPLISANISMVGSSIGTVTNEDGYFLLHTKDQDSVRISYLGYRTKTLSIKALNNVEPKEILLEYIGYNLPGVLISDISAKKVVDKILDNIDKNYVNEKHLSRGFYKEQLIHEDGRIFTYGEAAINTVKERYKNNPSLGKVKSLNDLAIFQKGFFEDFQELMEDDHGNFHLFPVVFGGGTVAILLDLFKSHMSFLLKSELDNYAFSYGGIVLDDERSAFIINFQPKNDKALFRGEMVIDEEDYAIISSTFYATDLALKRYNMDHEKANIISRKFDVKYKKTEEGYLLSQANTFSEFLFVPTGDQLTNTISYATVGSEVGGRIKVDKKKKIGSFDDMGSYVPKVGDFWKGQNIIQRSKNIELALQDKMETTQKEILAIKFEKAKYDKILEKARREKKWIFMDIYTTWCAPCIYMDKNVFNEPEVVKTMMTSFIPYKVDLERNRNHPIVKVLGVNSIPRLVIISPWGQIIYQIEGMMEAEPLNTVLQDISKNIDLNKIEAAVREEKEEEQILTSSIEIIANADSVTHKNPSLMTLSILGNPNKWGKEQYQFIHDYLHLLGPEHREYYIEHSQLFKTYLGEQVVNKNLYDILLSKVLSNRMTANDFLSKAEREMGSDYAYFKSRFSIDYYTYKKKDEARRKKYFIEHYTNFHDYEWAEVKESFAIELLSMEDPEQLKAFQNMLSHYEQGAKLYEWKDMHCVILMKLGREEEALAMMDDIRKLAYAEGVNYRSIMYHLQH